MKEITKKESSTDTYKINKPLKLNTINKGEPVDNVLVHDANNEIKSVSRSEFGGGSQSFQDVVTKSTIDMGGTAVASVEDPIDASKRGAFIVGKTDGVNIGAVVASSTSTSIGSYITEMGKIKMIQSTPDGTIKTELKINEPKVASNIYVPAPDVAGDYILATTQDISLDKAAAIGSTITDKEVIFNTTATDIKTSITKEGVLILENGVNDLGPTELKTLIGKNSIAITEKGFREEGGGSEGGITLARKNDANFSSNTVIKPTETQTLIDKKSITISEKGFLRDDGETKVLINKNNVSLSRTIPTENEINEIGLDADEWNLYAYQGDRGFNANPFHFAFSEGNHNVSFMLDGPINQTTQVRFKPLGGVVTYEDSFKTINGKSIVGNENIVLPTSGDFKTINGKSIVGSGDITLPIISNFKTINGKSIVGSGDIVIEGGASSGTYTPAMTNVYNVAHMYIDDAHWTRIGNIVTVKCPLQLSFTEVSAPSSIRISLPFNIASGSTNLGIGNLVTQSSASVTGIVQIDTASEVRFNTTSSTDIGYHVGAMMITYTAVPYK